jgi:hypothetical protein
VNDAVVQSSPLYAAVTGIDVDVNADWDETAILVKLLTAPQWIHDREAARRERISHKIAMTVTDLLCEL